MRLLAAGLLAALAAAPVALAAGTSGAPAPGEVSCNDGKITKKIAGVKWKMHGCSDGYSLIFLFKENDHRKMAIVAINHREAGYEIAGYGNVNQPEVKAAAEWARTLTVPEIEALYAETQAK